MGPIGGWLFAVGVISLIIGVFLLLGGVRSRGYMRARYGTYSGPTWFIFMIFGIVLMAIGASLPF